MKYRFYKSWKIEILNIHKLGNIDFMKFVKLK